MTHHGTLHVFAQLFQHDDCNIVGDRDGLERLRAAIDQALAGGQGECGTFVNDGEGYAVRVKLADEATMDTLAVPYTDENAKESQTSSAIWPWKL